MPTMMIEAILSAHELMGAELEPLSYLLEPILPKAGLAMLYAPRGVGKTNLALAIAIAVAEGRRLFNWHVKEPHSVLYVDGEMPMAVMQSRLYTLLAAQKLLPFSPENLHILSTDALGRSPDIGNQVCQNEMDILVEDYDLLVLDNLSSLMQGGENDSTDWQSMQDWLIRLRSRGVAVLMVHHAGKSGQQRGTSRREDVLDTVIALRRPLDYNPTQGSRFEVHIEKARQAWGEAIAPFEAHLLNEEGEETTAKWVVRALEKPNYLNQDARRQLFLQKLAEGAGSVEQVAQSLGVSRATAFRWVKEQGSLSLT